MLRDSMTRHLTAERTKARRRHVTLVPKVLWAMAGGVLFAALTQTSALAGPVEDAKAAQNRGDHATAAIINRAISRGGDDGALFRLGMLYRYGRGVERDYDEALKWFGRAAALGSAQAQYSLADMHLRGLGVRQNLLTSAKWYQRAAEQGHMRAQLVLGLLYKLGGGVRKNFTKAAAWFGRAAAQGQTEAQHELGLLHYAGDGVRKDYVAAYKWQLLARDNTRSARVRTSAEDALKKLNSAMTASQIAEAHRQARAWQAIPEGGLTQ